MMSKSLSIVTIIFFIFVCVPSFTIAKEYEVKVERVARNVYKITDTQYLIRTTLCSIKSKKGASKQMPAKLTISKLGNRINFTGRKMTCTVTKVYKEHSGELEGVK